MVAPAQAQFETRDSFGLVYPEAFAVGDFSGDGKLDVAASSIQLEVFLGNGNGTFQPPMSYSSVLGAQSVVAADFNHDGNLDLALATYLNDSVTIMLGNGDGTFRQGPILKAPASPYFAAVGDFNHDGNLDVVAIERGSECGCIAVFLGNGDGTFQAGVNTPVVDVDPFGLAVGDFNHDGLLDVAVTGFFGTVDQVSIWLGNGDGSFHEGESYALGSEPVSVVSADFNRDGNLDLAVGVSEGYEVSVLLGNGDGTFRTPVDYPVSFPEQVAVSDFNGDGVPDLAVSSGFDISGVSVFLGNGDGTFRSPAFYPTARVSGPIAIGDFNGDHESDILEGDSDGEKAYMLLNTGVAAFSPTTPLTFEGQAVGTTSPAQKVTLTNSRKTELKISTMKVAGQFGMSSTCGKGVAAGKSCTISVTFSPTSQGAKSGTVTINDSASSKPQVIELSGTGT
jgi:large repetitive protein